MPIYAFLKEGQVVDVRPMATNIPKAEWPQDDEKRPLLLPYEEAREEAGEEAGIDEEKNDDPALWDRQGPVYDVQKSKVVGRYSYSLKTDIEDVLIQRVQARIGDIHAVVAGVGNVCAMRMLIGREAEAKRYQQDDSPQADDYPLLAMKTTHPNIADLAAAARICLEEHARFKSEVVAVEAMAATIQQSIQQAADSTAKLAAFQAADFNTWQSTNSQQQGE